MKKKGKKILSFFFSSFSSIEAKKKREKRMKEDEHKMCKGEEIGDNVD